MTRRPLRCELVRRAGIGAEVVSCATGERPVRAERPRCSVLDNAKAPAAFGAMPPWQAFKDGLPPPDTTPAGKQAERKAARTTPAGLTAPGRQCQANTVSVHPESLVATLLCRCP